MSPPLTRHRSLADAVDHPSGSVWIVRHGERIDVVEPEWLSTAERPHDPPLTEYGRQQAAVTGAHLAARGDRVDFVYTSPFLRCVQTAAAIAKHLDAPLRVEPGLCEWLNGDWFESNDNPMDQAMSTGQLKHVADAEGVRIDECYLPFWDSAARVGSAARADDDREVAFPETSEDAVDRYNSTLEQVRTHSPHAVLVTHGYGIWTLSEWLVGREVTEDCGYCSATRTRSFRNLRGEAPWRCDVLAQDSHLDDLEGGCEAAPLGVSVRSSDRESVRSES